MASIQAGTYSAKEILDAANFDFYKEAAADYLNGGADYRRVQIGGLGFDSLDDCIVIPVTADTVTITLDAAPHTQLTVDLTPAQREERAYSFETAADADDPDQ